MLKIYQHDNSYKTLDQISDVISRGGVIVYPTGTTYALGCNALSASALRRISELLQRHARRKSSESSVSPESALHSIISYDFSEISKYALMDNATFKLMKRNLPGAFTFILCGTSLLPKLMRNRKTLGVRMPDSRVTSVISHAAGVPLIAATIPLLEDDDIGYVTNPELVSERWDNDVDLVIDGGEGRLGKSTIVDCTGDAPQIVRQGDGILVDG